MTMRADALPDCPEWRNPAMFIACIEKNISPTPEQRYAADALSARSTGQMTIRNKQFTSFVSAGQDLL